MEWLRIPRRLWRYQPRPRIVFLARPPEAVPDVRLILSLGEGRIGRSRFASSASISLAVHCAALIWLLTMPAGPQLSEEEFQLALRYRDATPLVAPPREVIEELTGSAPAVREITLEGLLAPPDAAPAETGPPEPQPSPATQPAPEPAAGPSTTPEPEAPEERAPQVETPQVVAEESPAAPDNPRLPVPAARPGSGTEAAGTQERPPLLAFENVSPDSFSRARRGAPSSGIASSGRPGASAIPPPPSSDVQQAIREAARAGGSGRGLIIGDVETGRGVFEARQIPPSPNNTGSNIQMMSDPRGVDFRPYLIRVLATVRRNWFSVMPSSVRLGRQGKVVIQFAIDRSGNVPKLVIAIPSGFEPYDRAAVAGISASNPFPPLPEEFLGDEVRLQLNFTYRTIR